jgi:hypothetical protein
MPNMEQFAEHIRRNARWARRMVTKDMAAGKSVAICGAGPSLEGWLDRLPPTHQVWACNSALPYLKKHGQRVTHGFCIDQGRAMLGPEEWARTYNVEYLLASAVHPDLVAHLLKAKRTVIFFHSYLGIPAPEGWVCPPPDVPYEVHLYRTLFPASVQVGKGLNSVPRAVCLAIFMGFKSIKVYGADCACAPAARMPAIDSPRYAPWLASLRMYPDRGFPEHYGHALMAEGLVNGRHWVTRPDMVMSAVHLVELAQEFPQVQLMGDTLPTALQRDPDALSRMPRFGEEFGELAGFGDSVLAEMG